MIRIEITADTATEARHQMSELLGKTEAVGREYNWRQYDVAKYRTQHDVGQTDGAADDEVLAEVGPDTERLMAFAKEQAAAEAPAPKRERGQPSAGRKRRTKEEIAEDEAADKIDAAREVEERQGMPAISTGGERTDPANPEPEVEDDPQDAIDEAEEVEAARDTVKPLTHDDVRALVRDYVAKYGMAAIQKDGPAIFAAALGTPPEGKAGWMVPDIPDDQAVLAVAVKAWAEAVASNPFSREVVAK
jgi:hypothetical protein